MSSPLEKLFPDQAVPAQRVDLQSLVDTHHLPFWVIDRDHRVLAINRAFETEFGIAAATAVGGFCHQVLRDFDGLCRQPGPECPHTRLFADGHGESVRRLHQVTGDRGQVLRTTAWPLRGADGECYVGERFEDLFRPPAPVPKRKRMVGESAVFHACREQLELAAASDVPVLLYGETGTGKELAAHHVHACSRRRDRPFLTIDCTVLTETLFEAEVFGHARGAFTGSVGERIGLFEQADGGTLFLDEMGELPLTQQVKLLRALESGQFRRVGGRSMRSSDVRIICATNRHLLDRVRDGRFREDLYYRIACLAVRIPPLRERLDDIDLLASALLEPIALTMHRPFRLSQQALRHLHGHRYPGNIRELRNILFDAAAHCQEDEIGADRISAALNKHTGGEPGNDGQRVGLANPADPLAGLPSESLREVEAWLIAALLEKYACSRKRVAAAMGISERTLYRKIRRYELQPQ